MNLVHTARLSRAPHTGTWFRAVPQHHFGTALAYQHTATTPGRFSPGTPGRSVLTVLYLAENPQVLLYEVQAMLGSPLPGQPVAPNPLSGAWTAFAVQVILSRVVDLCDQSQLQLLDTSVQELTGDWRGYPLRTHVQGHLQTAPTQQLGAALFSLRRVEGFMTYSARMPTHRNLVVFPTRLRKGSRIELIDPHTRKGQRITAGGVIANIP